MKQKSILIVEDDAKIRMLLRDFLEREGFNVLESPNGRHALETFEKLKNEIDLIILDVMLPEIDGWTVCRSIRKISSVPIVMLTARSEDADEILGLELGADDYVKKPVKPTTLIARIKAILRRIENGEEIKSRLSFEGIEIDEDSYKVTVDGSEIVLSPKEFSLLLILVKNKGKIISREQLLDAVWGIDYEGGLRTVDTHINRLRSKLGKYSYAIETVRGFGYRFGGSR
ncbi:response regulator transcription factor [Thermovorax subterraneus]|nr:response regulator transcription factor [Thermovorax subterraneus]